MRLPLLVYNLLLILLLPLILLSYLIKLIKRPDYRLRWSERLGNFPPVKQSGGLHIHAVSLGEAKVAAKVVDALRAERPELPIVFTCSTATASAFILKTYGDSIDHCHLPLDLPWLTRAFINRYQPKGCVITEVEWWPNLIHGYAKRGLPVVMINAKMTSSSAQTYQKLHWLFGVMVDEVSRVLVQNSQSFEQFQQLQIEDSKLRLTNNIKFDERPPQQFASSIDTLREQIGDRPVWIAGSTHADDEAAILEAFKPLKMAFPDLLLILVPRHPERFAEVADKALAQQYQLAKRSSNQAVEPTTDILLGDTLGELSALYSLADVAFVGGSITNRGGHNPLEAAIFGIPIVMGASQFNAADISQQLCEAGAMIIVEDGSSIARQLQEWFQSPEVRQAAGEQSAAVIAANQGALAITLDEITRQLSSSESTHEPV